MPVIGKNNKANDDPDLPETIVFEKPVQKHFLARKASKTRGINVGICCSTTLCVIATPHGGKVGGKWTRISSLASSWLEHAIEVPIISSHENKV